MTFHHSKCAAPWDSHACQISSCSLQYCKSYGQRLSFRKNGQTDCSTAICHPIGGIKKEHNKYSKLFLNQWKTWDKYYCLILRIVVVNKTNQYPFINGTFLIKQLQAHQFIIHFKHYQCGFEKSKSRTFGVKPNVKAYHLWATVPS